MRDPLVVDIRPTVHNNILIYVVQILHQQHTGNCFTISGNSFTATNGFKLSSQSCPALYKRRNGLVQSIHIKGKRVNGTWSHDVDMIYVRGSDCTRDRTRMYTDSVVYVERLKLAIAEYNDHMRGD